MAVEQFNLATNQRAERKLLITVTEWTETEGSASVQKREILGRRIPASSTIRIFRHLPISWVSTTRM